MSTHYTLFTGTIIQDSALSVSGLDREAPTDKPFTIVDGRPVMNGEGIKGALVAMARRFFDPLPAVISSELEGKAHRSSCWKTFPARCKASPEFRSGVGILQKTGARAESVLFDAEVIPAGTTWEFRVGMDWHEADEEAPECEAILGYVLHCHWAEGRCWLGGGVARGLGWAHVEDLEARRLDAAAYEAWQQTDQLPPAKLAVIPTAKPSRSWSFRTLRTTIHFGEYQPENDGLAWGVDSLSIGPHSYYAGRQERLTGTWADGGTSPMVTDRPVQTSSGRPVLPGSSIRGPLRHEYSRMARALNLEVQDPHLVQGRVPPTDPAAKLFGSVEHSSKVLICDGLAIGEWYGARFHLHAEDEFTAGSYESAKRDSIRILKASFPVRIVVEGPDAETVDVLTNEMDKTLGLGSLQHLGFGGHKTKSGFGRIDPYKWEKLDIRGSQKQPRVDAPGQTRYPWWGRKEAIQEFKQPKRDDVRIGMLFEGLGPRLHLLEALKRATRSTPIDHLQLWWCDPSLDFDKVEPPVVADAKPPIDDLEVDEAAFFFPSRSVRFVRDGGLFRMLEMFEESNPTQNAEQAVAVERDIHPLALGKRFQMNIGVISEKRWLMREWYQAGAVIGFTIRRMRPGNGNHS